MHKWTENKRYDLLVRTTHVDSDSLRDYKRSSPGTFMKITNPRAFAAQSECITRICAANICGRTAA